MPPFSFDPRATYDLISLDTETDVTSQIVAGSLFIARHGKLDQVRAWGEIRDQTLFLVGTSIVIGQLLGAVLTLTRTQARFTLVRLPAPAERPSSPA